MQLFKSSTEIKRKKSSMKLIHGALFFSAKLLIIYLLLSEQKFSFSEFLKLNRVHP